MLYVWLFVIYCFFFFFFFSSRRRHTRFSRDWSSDVCSSDLLIDVDFDLTQLAPTEENRLMALMLHYDFYQTASDEMTLEESIKIIGLNKDLVAEMKEFLEVKIDKIGFEEIPCVDLGYSFPLQIHACYTREQILVAMRLSTLGKKSSNREGVALNKALNTEALFINLKKSEEDFSPTTLYDDYAINELLFHW